jgi:signal peptidase I
MRQLPAMNSHTSLHPEPTSRADRLWAEIIATVGTMAAALAIALLLRVTLYQPFTIPSASMEPGLVEGDYIMVAKFSYGWSRASLPFSPPVGEGRLFGRTPDRGDVIVFRSPTDGRTAVIKRVIGLPGDEVRFENGAVILNGRAVPIRPLGRVHDPDAGASVLQLEERAPGGRTYRTFDRGPGREGDDTDVYRVPAGHYFVLGDNRDNSLDSRWPAGWGQGFVPAENLMGEAHLILVSWRPGASLFKPWTWLSLQSERALKRVA